MRLVIFSSFRGNTHLSPHFTKFSVPNFLNPDSLQRPATALFSAGAFLKGVPYATYTREDAHNDPGPVLRLPPVG